MAGMVFIISIPTGKCQKVKRNKKSIKKNLLDSFDKKENYNDESKILCKNDEKIVDQIIFEKNSQGQTDNGGKFENSYFEKEADKETREQTSNLSHHTLSNESVTRTAPKTFDIISEELEQKQLEQNIPNSNLQRKILSSFSDCKIKKTRSYECLGGEDNKQMKLSSMVERNSIRKSWEGIKGLISTGTKDKEINDNEENLVEIDLTHNSTMEEIIRESLRLMEIQNSSWIISQDKQNYQIIFSMESEETEDCEKLLGMLTEWGIGELAGSSISVLPCTIYHKPQILTPTDDKLQNNVSDPLKEKSAWDRFLASIRARLNVAQIVEEVKKEARITFDFICLLIVAAVLAAFGLIENSTIFLTSSMLISPLMGPIIAAIFGTVIKDKKLQCLGVTNELIGIFLATFVGFIFGIIECIIDDKYGVGDGLTDEMKSRCDLHSLVVGIFTALPSGAAVAIAILGENIGSLVGVAISASLLPPAVNAGVFWALSIVYAIFQQDDSRYNAIVKTNKYSDHQSIELAVYGSISMGLTIINVICIYVMGVLFLKIKEVAPIASRNHRQFWKHDIKIARDYYKTCQSEDALSLSKKLADEIAGFQHNEHEQMDNLTTQIHRTNLLHKHQNTWSPLSNRHHQYTLMDSKPAVQDLEALFLNNVSPQHSHSRPITFRRQSLMGKTISPPFSNKEILSYLNHERDHHHLRREHITIGGHYNSFRSASVPLDKIIESIQSGNGHGHHTNNKLCLPTEAVIEIDENKLLNSGESLTKKFIVTPAALTENDF